MKNNRSRLSKKAFTLIELLVVVLILGILSGIALPSYLSSVYSARIGTANANARVLSTAVQSKALMAGAYDTTLSDFATDMGGAIPVNPCTGTTTGYTITIVGTKATIQAVSRTNCGAWTPTTYTVGYSNG